MVEFDFASLGLSSYVAVKAVDEIREHTQALDATVEMDYQDAIQLHETEIKMHEENLGKELG